MKDDSRRDDIKSLVHEVRALSETSVSTLVTINSRLLKDYSAITATLTRAQEASQPDAFFVASLQEQLRYVRQPVQNPEGSPCVHLIAKADLILVCLLRISARYAKKSHTIKRTLKLISSNDPSPMRLQARHTRWLPPPRINQHRPRLWPSHRHPLTLSSCSLTDLQHFPAPALPR
jgi:hypothetical protein